MAMAFNKVNFAYISIDDTSSLQPASDWIIDPIFDDPANALVRGPKCWVWNDTDNNIHVMTAAEADADPNHLNEIVTDVIEKIRKLKDDKLTGGYTDANSITWGTTEEDIRNYNALCTMISLGVIADPQTITFRDITATDRVLSITDFVTLTSNILAYAQAIYDNAFNHIHNVQAMTLVSQVEAYDYTTGW